ncbi:MAG: hypothetical protein M1825_001121 [Sarcosagium campestre]|nr:MAG: hypothetical protein M1825_001121 [Sarcosagium campestre]
MEPHNHPPSTSQNRPLPLILGISGPSSSGKTTLAHLLRSVIAPESPSQSQSQSQSQTACRLQTQPVHILHQDDFYKPEVELPLTRTKDGTEHRDWDRSESFDLDRFRAVVSSFAGVPAAADNVDGDVKDESEGERPYTSIQPVDINLPDVDETILEKSRARLRQALRGHEDDEEGRMQRDVVIVEGILLYPHITDLLSPLARLFLRASKEQVVRRREGRDGYAVAAQTGTNGKGEGDEGTGWWRDPEGYVEDVVWEGYKDEMAWLFERGDVEGNVDAGVVEREGLSVWEGEEGKLWEDLLGWAVDRLVEAASHSHEGA